MGRTIQTATTSDLSAVRNVALGAKSAAEQACAAIATHQARTDNPHSDAKAHFGLEKVDNTADIDKPASTIQKAYIDGKISDLVGDAPAALDTLKEVADKLATEDSAIAALISQVAAKEPAIVAGLTTQYLRGDKTWRDFAGDVLGVLLTGIVFTQNAAVVATDTVKTAIGKLQTQITAAFSRLTTLEAQKTSSGADTIILTNLLSTKTQDITISFLKPMPSANYEINATIAAISSLALFGNLKITPKTKNLSSVTLTVQNTSLVTLSGSATIIVIAQS